MTEEDLIPIPPNPSLKPPQSIQAQALPITEPPDIDRIGNKKQKESALHKAKVTREKAFKVVHDALVAVKKIEYRDSEGHVQYNHEPDIPRNQWGAEMAAKYFADFVTKIEGNENGIRQLVIIRPDAVSGEAKEAQKFSRQIRVQSSPLPGDVQLMGYGKNDVIDISGNAIQRVDTK